MCPGHRARKRGKESALPVETPVKPIKMPGAVPTRMGLNMPVKPPSRRAPVAIPRKTVKPTDKRPIKVLLVDDHAMITEGLSRVLGAERGIEIVATAGSGAEVFVAIDRHKPDVVVMDYQLPDIDGATVTRELRSTHPETRVIMLTGSTDDRVLVDAIEAGCSGYITKVNAVDELAAAVRAAHIGESVISPSMLARLLPRFKAKGRDRSTSELSKRELEVIRLLAEGLSNIEIAQRLVVSLNTVRNHVQSIITKLDAHSKLEAVSTAVRRGIISYPANPDSR